MRNIKVYNDYVYSREVLNLKDFLKKSLVSSHNIPILKMDEKSEIYYYDFSYINKTLYSKKKVFEIIGNAENFIRYEERKIFELDNEDFKLSEENIELLRDSINRGFNVDDIYWFLRDYYSKNEYMYNFLTENSSANELRRELSDNAFMNFFYNSMLNSPETMEKILKSYDSKFFVVNCFNNINFFNDDAKKLKSVVGLPKETMNLLKKDSFTKLYPKFKELAKNRDNSEILSLSNYITKFLEIESDYNNFKNLEKLLEIFIISNKGIIQTLDYLHKQELNYISLNLNFKLSLDTLIKYRDYLDMSKEYSKKFNSEIEYFPNNLFAAHYIAVKNHEVDSNFEDKDLVNACSKYSKLKYEGDDYILKTPESINEMIKEGVELKHCVASYIDKIIEGEAIVLFLRKKDKPETPFVTVEVDSNINLIQVKEKYDEDIRDLEIMQFIFEWRKSMLKKNIDTKIKEAYNG